ncbi:hypothetical protein [Blastomonas aquatica]|uniref:Mlr4354 like protein n=1 Tax=Blastomonas aquatica TaxID=1510276 RepID=A0ABQ1JFP0_9SPHN|nr:hypothetical protein [Blastomonas aquatica]GGB65211.1 hypothetical protein GCM10010833_20510 [Blastomonas aquatica]
MKCWLAALAVPAALFAATPLQARDSLGVFDGWGAFRDPQLPRCYAIAQPYSVRGRREYRPFASIGYWPRRGVRGQFHLRLSRAAANDETVTLAIGVRRFTLSGGGGDAWARDKAMDAAIIAAMRSAREMTAMGTGTDGKPIRDVYPLKGAATALDAAALGCAARR